MAKINIQQGQSLTLDFKLIGFDLTKIQEIVIFIGNQEMGRLTDNLIVKPDGIYRLELDSNSTQTLNEQYLISVSIDHSEYGVFKIAREKMPILIVGKNNNFSNGSVTNAARMIEINFVDGILTTNVELATYYRGYSALEVYRVEKGDNALTLEDMLEEQNKLDYRVVQVQNVQDGDIIEHNLGGQVLMQLVENNQIVGGAWGEYLNNNSITLRTPFLQDVLNVEYTGYAIFTKLADVYGRKRIIEVLDLHDGDNVRHNLNGQVLMQYIDNGQVQGGFYGITVDNNNIIFKTPSLDGQTFSTGYLLCTKLS